MISKSTLVMFAAATTLLSGFGGTQIGRAYTENHCYPLTTVVTEVNHGTDVVTVTDSNGNEWQFSGCEDWTENDICSLLMTTNGTVGIYDDSIIKAVYGGNAEDLEK